LRLASPEIFFISASGVRHGEADGEPATTSVNFANAASSFAKPRTTLLKLTDLQLQQRDPCWKGLQGVHIVSQLSTRSGEDVCDRIQILDLLTYVLPCQLVPSSLLSLKSLANIFGGNGIRSKSSRDGKAGSAHNLAISNSFEVSTRRLRHRVRNFTVKGAGRVVMLRGPTPSSTSPTAGARYSS